MYAWHIRDDTFYNWEMTVRKNGNVVSPSIPLLFLQTTIDDSSSTFRHGNQTYTVPGRVTKQIFIIHPAQDRFCEYLEEFFNDTINLADRFRLELRPNEDSETLNMLDMVVPRQFEMAPRTDEFDGIQMAFDHVVKADFYYDRSVVLANGEMIRDETVFDAVPPLRRFPRRNGWRLAAEDTPVQEQKLDWRKCGF